MINPEIKIVDCCGGELVVSQGKLINCWVTEAREDLTEPRPSWCPELEVSPGGHTLPGTGAGSRVLLTGWTHHMDSAVLGWLFAVYSPVFQDSGRWLGAFLLPLPLSGRPPCRWYRLHPPVWEGAPEDLLPALLPRTRGLEQRGQRARAWLVTQSCPTLCDPMDCSPPGSSVHGILQARILEWVFMSSSRGSS